MAEGSLVYKVQDRSVLLPLYKRFAINPALPFIPESVNPNTITHIGHLLNLSACVILLSTSPKNGWPFAIAALLLHLYNWCDNADGGHARRTGQTSAMGEFLDHGLDMLNTVYIAVLSAIGIGAPPIAWLAITIVLPAAAGSTYWEQAETGMFHLGRMNQIESVFALALVLIVAAIFGSDVYEHVHYGTFTLRMAIMIFVLGTASIGMLHGIYRVAKTGLINLVPIVPLHVFNGSVAAAAMFGAVAPSAAVIIATAGNVFFGLRMLAVRLAQKEPRVEYGLLAGALAMWGLIAWRLYGRPVGFLTDASYATVAVTVFGALALLNARDGVRRVLIIDRAAREAAAATAE